MVMLDPEYDLVSEVGEKKKNIWNRCHVGDFSFSW